MRIKISNTLGWLPILPDKGTVKGYRSLPPVENHFEDQECALVPFVREAQENYLMNFRSRVVFVIFGPSVKRDHIKKCLILPFEDGSRGERNPTQVSQEQIKKFKGKKNFRGMLVDRMV